MPTKARPRKPAPTPAAGDLLRDLLAALKRDPDPAVSAWAKQFTGPGDQTPKT